MKAFVFVLLCALVAVQGRYTALKSTRTDGDDAINENPWVVYLRIAVSTSGLLNTGMGSLIDERWVLTTAANVVDARFIWLRYGAADVLHPALVTESSTVSIHPNYNANTGEHNIGLINTQRNIQFQANIAPVSMNGLIGASTVVGTTCVYIGTIHKTLFCFHINAAKDDNAGLGITGPNDVQVSSDDFGSPLVIDGGQAALLVGLGNEEQEIPGTYLETTDYVDWLQTETGVDLNPDADNDGNDDNDDNEVEPDPVRVVQ